MSQIDHHVLERDFSPCSPAVIGIAFFGKYFGVSNGVSRFASVAGRPDLDPRTVQRVVVRGFDLAWCVSGDTISGQVHSSVLSERERNSSSVLGSG